MPWHKVKGGGYTTARGGHVGNPSQYEALRRKGMPKGEAAAITNLHKAAPEMTWHLWKVASRAAHGSLDELVRASSEAEDAGHSRDEIAHAIHLGRRVKPKRVGGGATVVPLHKARKPSDASLKMRVWRKGPYTKANRKQLAHHTAVGAGLGGSAGAAVGAHLGAHMHASDVAEAMHGESMFTRYGLEHVSRGRAAAAGAVAVGGLGALYGAAGGAGVASVRRRNRALSKAEHRKRDLAMVGTGAVGLQAAASHTNIANRYADHDAAKHETRMAAAKATHARVSAEPKGDWRRHLGPDVNEAQARELNNKVRNLKIDAAQRNVAGVKRSAAMIPHRRAVLNRYLLGAGAVGGALAYTGLHHMAKPNPTVAKAAYKRDVTDTAAGGTAGGAGYLATGMFAVKPRKAEKQVHENPEMRATWNAHRKATGMSGREAYKHYPLSLPGAKRQRFLARHMGGRAGDALMAGTIVAGGATGLAIARHKDKKALAKSEPLAIAGKLWRKPTVRSEFMRAYHDTRKGEKIVDAAARTRKMRAYRDPWGYRRVEPTKGHLGGEAREALRARTAYATGYSPHKTGFSAGVKTGQMVASAGRHPEYAISVPAVGAGAGLAHHEIKRAKNKKGTEVAKSAFGVELEKGLLQAVKDLPKADKIEAGIEAGVGVGAVGVASHKAKKQKAAVAKYQSGTITYHQNAADLHRRMRNSGRAQAATGAVIGGAGVAAHQNAKRIGLEVGRRLRGNEDPGLGDFGPREARNIRRAYVGARRGGKGMAIGGGALLAVGAGRAFHHGHMQNVEAKRAQAARRERNASIVGEVGKSAFGVDLVEKNALTEAFDTGIHALRGFKSGMSGSIGAERTGAGAAGKVAGAKTMGKLKPIGAAMTKTPQRTAATFGLGGIGVGMAANRN